MRREAVVAQFGPLPTHARSSRSRRRRSLLTRQWRVVCACLLLALLLLHMCAHEMLAHDLHEHRAENGRGGRSGIDLAPVEAQFPVELDVVYPHCDESYWSSSVTQQPGWMERMRARWVDSLEKRPRDSDGLPLIPPLLHQTWKDSAPPKVLFAERWRRAVQDANVGWEYHLWTDAENRQLIAQSYPRLLHTYDSYPSAIQRADAARYVLAYHYGGVYLDMDVECYRPLAPLLANASLVLSYKAGSNFSRGVSNSIFASAPHHPFWLAVFDVLLNRSLTPLTSHRDVLYSTGPAVLREAIRRLLHLAPSMLITAGMLGSLRSEVRRLALVVKRLRPRRA
uniref:Uncharacterized protein n=1 Tax=Calcidiscus leptoporus TaxID=127549 RepID=A0A7S0P4S5_9EUKA|mmetsp:Transcript_54784/g.126153  ORF Transcript_54784/g.126153 Transcript_54784/m.126153 type:complete len:339 (+) Transcript_54784:8-1024(+)